MRSLRKVIHLTTSKMVTKESLGQSCSPFNSLIDCNLEVSHFWVESKRAAPAGGLTCLFVHVFAVLGDVFPFGVS